MGPSDLAGHCRDHHVRRRFALDDFIHVIRIRSFQGSAGKGDWAIRARIQHRRYPFLPGAIPTPSSNWSNSGSGPHLRRADIPVRSQREEEDHPFHTLGMEALLCHEMPNDRQEESDIRGIAGRLDMPTTTRRAQSTAQHRSRFDMRFA